MGLAATPARAQGETYRRYLLAVLVVIYALNFLDRQIINILAESIKKDLAISDAQLGLLTGTAFGIFYSLLGLPIARLADRSHRVNIIAISLTIWSALTAVCGLTHTYAQLFLARLGVGIGEAGGTPASQALISDHFPLDRRATAMAIFNMGVPLGSFLGFLMGGYINDWLGWRAAFLIAGLPGLLVVLLVKLTLREPIRGAADGLETRAAEPPAPLRETLKGLFARRSFAPVILGGTCGIFIVYITNAWLPSYFIRLHGLSAGEAGRWLALCIGLGGAIGALGGGALVDLLKPKVARAEILVLTISTALTFPAFLLTVLSRDTTLALAGMFLLYALAYVWMGPTSSMVQSIAPVRSRALATGVQLFAGNVISLAFGPPLIGLLSDHLGQTMGADGLRYALALGSIVALVGTGLYLLAGRWLLADVKANAA